MFSTFSRIVCSTQSITKAAPWPRRLSQTPGRMITAGAEVRESMFRSNKIGKGQKPRIDKLTYKIEHNRITRACNTTFTEAYVPWALMTSLSLADVLQELQALDQEVHLRLRLWNHFLRRWPAANTLPPRIEATTRLQHDLHAQNVSSEIRPRRNPCRR